VTLKNKKTIFYASSILIHFQSEYKKGMCTRGETQNTLCTRECGNNCAKWMHLYFRHSMQSKSHIAQFFDISSVYKLQCSSTCFLVMWSLLELMVLTRGGGGELFKASCFRKYWLIMKINDDLQIKEPDQPRKQID